MTGSDAEGLAQFLHELVGLTCWMVIGDEAPNVHLGFGEQIRRKSPLLNATLTEQERINEAANDLFITCPWRLEGGGQVVATELSGGKALEVVRGLEVVAATADAPGYDLTVAFSDGHRLVAFADEIRPGLDSYSVGRSGAYAVVGPYSVLSHQEPK